jgi:hypothetical protein
VTPDPLEDPAFARRVASLQTLCLGVIVGLVGITVGFWMVVWFALDGIPLAGNFFQIAGVSVVVWAAGLLTAAAMIAAPAVGRAKGRAGLARVAAGHPELAGSEDEAERVFDVFAAVVFAEYAVAGGTAFALAVTFHLTSLFPVVGCVAALLLFLAARYPTAGRARTWFAAAWGELAVRRRPSPR